MRVDRRGFLRIAGLGAAATAAWPAQATAGGRPSVFDLRFSLAEQYRPFALLAPGFVQHDAAPGRVSGIVRTTARPVAPFASVVLDVAALDARVAAGLVRDERNSVLATYEAGRARIEVTRDGTTTVVGAVDAALTPPFGFAFVVCENQVTVLVDSGEGFQPLLTRRNEVAALIDLRRPDVLAAHRYGYGGGAVTLRRAQAGYFGQAGVRDPHVVQWSDGTPYIRDGKLYLTLTDAGLGFFQQAHWGVWTLDLADPTKLEQVAILFFARDGVIVGDHAGQIVWDDRRDEFSLLMSSWGDFAFRGVHVRFATTPADVLSGVHVVATDPLPLPTPVSSWDPASSRARPRRRSSSTRRWPSAGRAAASPIFGWSDATRPWTRPRERSCSGSAGDGTCSRATATPGSTASTTSTCGISAGSTPRTGRTSRTRWWCRYRTAAAPAGSCSRSTAPSSPSRCSATAGTGTSS
jgi:hypothetical protein